MCAHHDYDGRFSKPQTHPHAHRFTMFHLSAPLLEGSRFDVRLSLHNMSERACLSYVRNSCAVWSQKNYTFALAEMKLNLVIILSMMNKYYRGYREDTFIKKMNIYPETKTKGVEYFLNLEMKQSIMWTTSRPSKFVLFRCVVLRSQNLRSSTILWPLMIFRKRLKFSVG